jgi:hypothetical protein
MAKDINDAIDNGTIDVYDDKHLVLSANCIEQGADPIMTVTIISYLGDTYTLSWSDYGSEMLDDPPAKLISSSELDKLEHTRNKLDAILKANGR